MHPDGIDTIYSPYVRNTAASSSTTMIVPNSPPPSDNNNNDDDDEQGVMVEEKGINEDNYDPTFDMKKQKQPYYHYNSLEHPHTPLCQLHQDKRSALITPINTTIPIPFSPVFTTHHASSYFPTITASSSASTPAPLPITNTPTSISAAAVASSTITASTSPKKKVKRWIVAALMIIVGLLIALTFILIGLGKAFSQPQHHTPPSALSLLPSSSSSPSSSTSSILSSSSSSPPIYITATATATATATSTATATATATATITNLLVSPVHHPTLNAFLPFIPTSFPSTHHPSMIHTAVVPTIVSTFPSFSV
ncbi:hypothetical protein BCR42DRAFT_393913 [Absidia repens]|uniref:Uncharacterized protein n=1 Tax=Absidia repens TaxID=90262 RepID=A0A1X2IBQ8_9FUNG|nr:hypothetical protein BCR42DRAFT_393913 [Absidia repens]